MTDPLTPAADREAETAGVALNERLAEALGWTRSEEFPEYWVPPADQLPPKGIVYECPDYLTGNGMLEVIAAMRDHPNAFTRYRFARWLRDHIETLGVGPDISVTWVLHLTPELVAQAAFRALEEK